MKNASHILWPAAIIGLLLFSVVLMMTVLYAAHSDGGARVVEDYYARATSWDSLKTARLHSDDLGWTVEISFDRGSTAESTSLALEFSDREGNALEGLTGSVVLSQPHESAPFASLEFGGEGTAGPAAGQFRIHLDALPRGLIDLQIRAESASENGADVFLTRHRTEY